MSNVVKMCASCARFQIPIFAPSHPCGAPATCQCIARHVEIVPDEVELRPVEPGRFP
jgi:hypothetical protein